MTAAAGPPPTLCAGPILRRAEPSAVVVWVATRVPARVGVEVSRLVGADHRPVPVGGGDGRQVRMGPGLFVHLALARPHDGAFPTDEILAYDVEIETEGAGCRLLVDLGRVGGEASIAYGDLPLPTFVLRSRSPELHILHGSCRLLHGKGDDAFVAADEAVAGCVLDAGARPSALFLTGDQIYGDEVGGPLIGHLTALGRELLGPDDERSVPGLPALSEIPVYGRQQLARERAHLTSTKAGNHLFSQGEFAATYLVAWDEANWPERFPTAEEAVPDDGPARPWERRKLRMQYETELAGLEVARRALPAVRRVLANVPTYMAFDDHDVTDDWNLTREWRDQVCGSPAGRRVVANALGAFWAFQGWGNSPEHFDDAFIDVVSTGPGGPEGTAGEAYDDAMWGFDRWSYTVPTDPPTIVLDTRTQRTFDSDHGAARLLGAGELERVVQLAGQAGVAPPGPVIFVSAVPMFGLELQERRQKYLVGKVGPYAIDFEAWHSDLSGLVEFMSLAIDDLGLDRCIVLSGDVHYGINVDASFRIDDRRLAIDQLVSSSFKHSGTLARTALDLLGRAVGHHHCRVGWDGPLTPELRGLVGRLQQRAVNTDEWDDSSPVFLDPKMAERLQVDEPPRYEETRTYLRPEESGSVVVGESNVGLVTIADGRVEHRLLGIRNGVIVAHTVRFPPSPDDQPAATTSHHASGTRR